MNENAELIQKSLSGIEEKLSAAIAERDAEIKANGQASEAVGAKVDELAKEYSEQNAELAESLKGIKDDLAEMQAKANAASTAANGRRKTLGQRFTESEEYKNYVEGRAHGKSQTFELGHTLGGLNTKTTFTGSSLGDTAAYMYEVERFAEYVKDPDRMQFVRELLPTYGTSSGSIEFVREDAFTNNAGMVPEYATTDSGEKPESAVTFEIVSVPVKTMAHWIPATRQIVDDERQLRGYIENRLLYGLRLKEDQQLLYGTGTGDEINGILTDSDIQSYSQTSDETLIDAIRRAITVANVDEYRPTGVVLNHNDWEDIELEKGSDNHYIWVNVTTDNGNRLWGLPVVTTNAIDEGTVLVGDFQRGSAVHDRENAVIRITDSHSDLFTKNIWAILAEERIAQSILRPNAFVEVTAYSG